MSDFLDSNSVKKNCLLIGFDHDNGWTIVLDALALFSQNKNCRFVRLDFDYLCWSPEHFLARTNAILLHLGQGPNRSSMPSEAARSVSDSDTAFGRQNSTLITDFFSKLDFEAGKKGKKTVVICENIHRLQVFFHYPLYRHVFHEMERALENSSQLLFIITGRPPFRRENAYASFLRFYQSRLYRIQPMTSEDIQVWFRERGHQLSRVICDHLCNKTSGIQAYLPFVEKLLPTWFRSKNTVIIDRINTLFECRDEKSDLDQYLQQRYFLSIERAKGFGGLRTILSTLTHNISLTLTKVATLINKSPAATKDYLDSLCEIGLIVKRKKEYSVTDPVMSFWLRINEDRWADPCVQKTLETIYHKQYNQLPSARGKEFRPSLSRKDAGTKRRNDTFIEFD